MREDYTPPVGFAHEPAERRRNWIFRIITAAFLIFILWLFLTRVLHPPSDTPSLQQIPEKSQLPDPS